jgi:ketosteroid isomerase-like protein
VTVQEWLDGYARAWEEKDAEIAAELFTEDCVYQDQPFSEAHRGRDGVRGYWNTVCAPQEDPKVTFGEPVVSADGRRAAAEFWVKMVNGGAQVTLTGILFLRFAAGGLCEELREAWHFAEGFLEPSPSWGS